MARVAGMIVIALFVVMWMAGETPRSLKNRILMERAEHASFANAGGQGSDWGRP